MNTNIITKFEHAHKIFSDYEKEITRFNSWDYCYEAFKKAHEKNFDNDEEKEKIIDDLSQKLFMYLASWGMLRNSFLLWCDYKIHNKLIEDVLLSDKYKELWNIKLTDFKDDKIGLLDDLVNRIKKYYKQIRIDVFKVIGKKLNKDSEISETLISKILLGTLACSPAYDDYLKKAIGNIGVGPSNLNSLKNLVKNKEIQEAINTLSKTSDYPQMKLLDCCLWQIGSDLSKKKK